MLADDLRAEGVGRDEVGSGLKILAVNAGNYVGIGERKGIAVARQTIGLKHRSHRSVQDKDSLIQKLA